MKIAYYQQDIVWEDTEANLEKIKNVAENLKPDTSLFILPEMFHAGFTMDPGKVAEPMDGRVVTFLKDLASRHNMSVIGSAVISEDDKYYNRLLVVSHDGKVEKYDKRHLFSVGGEDKSYQPGEEKLVTAVKDVRILPLICYDLRFPVWSRQQNDYDLLIYIANWPASRSEVWKTLLKARAIENQSYVIGVNRVGRDESITYSGDSMVIDAKGRVVSDAKDDEGVYYAGLDIEELKTFRKKFPVRKDADRFKIL
jgi:predicted amidohydrolase